MTSPNEDLSAADRLLDGDAAAALKYTRRAQLALAGQENRHPALIGRIAGLLIDCAAELRHVELAEEGLAIIESNFALLAEHIQPYSLHYNIANAKKTIYDLGRSSRTEFNPAAIPLLTDAKDHYWQALRLAKSDDPQLLVNLANALDHCCRVAEALRYYDRALAVAPGFPMAHLNRGLALLVLKTLSDSFSISQLMEAKRSFLIAETSQLPSHLRDLARDRRLALSKWLLENGWSDNRTSEYDETHRLESEQHDPYWQFCLDNYLALSEHAMYCRCLGARRDDLSIPKSTGPIGGDFVGPLELLLNRIKSEFCLARVLYYQSISNPRSWPLHTFEGTFTELNDQEAIGLAPDFLRTSFRLCFGVLDRIAQGLSELFALAPKGATLYFESFWRPASDRSKGTEERWRKINEQRNWGLVALYSIATDLNRRSGQWGFFKEHRNHLEHGLLVLLNEAGASIPAVAMPKRIALEQLPHFEFQAHTLHMLQLTASAIFSFVFCVRWEGLRQLSDGPADRIELTKKPIGKE